MAPRVTAAEEDTQRESVENNLRHFSGWKRVRLPHVPIPAPPPVIAQELAGQGLLQAEDGWVRGLSKLVDSLSLKI